MNSSAPASRAACTISSKLASGFEAAIVSRIEPRNRKFSCSTTPRLVAQMIDIDLAQIVTVDLDEPLIVAVQQLQQTRDRRLARAAAPDNAEHRALGDRERHLV